MSTMELLREIRAKFPDMNAYERAIMQKQVYLALPKIVAVVEAVEFLKLDRKAPEDMTGREFRLHQAYRLLLEGG